jgi:hypothetical protein
MLISLELEEYDALVSLARKGATEADTLRAVNAFTSAIEKKNNVKRYFLWVQWQEGGTQLPPTARFPESWPPQLRCSLERTDRPIARADVTRVLSTRATKPTTILVTTDPGGVLGWLPIDDYFKG